MLRLSIAKQFAPFEHTDVDEMSIEGSPELRATARWRGCIIGAKVGGISDEMHAEYSGAAKQFAAIHRAA